MAAPVEGSISSFLCLALNVCYVSEKVEVLIQLPYEMSDSTLSVLISVNKKLEEDHQELVASRKGM